MLIDVFLYKTLAVEHLAKGAKDKLEMLESYAQEEVRPDFTKRMPFYLVENVLPN